MIRDDLREREREREKHCICNTVICKVASTLIAQVCVVLQHHTSQSHHLSDDSSSIPRDPALDTRWLWEMVKGDETKRRSTSTSPRVILLPR